MYVCALPKLNVTCDMKQASLRAFLFRRIPQFASVKSARGPSSRLRCSPQGFATLSEEALSPIDAMKGPTAFANMLANMCFNVHQYVLQCECGRCECKIAKLRFVKIAVPLASPWQSHEQNQQDRCKTCRRESVPCQICQETI